MIIQLALVLQFTASTPPTPPTYCNPLNLDYAHTPITRAAAQAPHRATADPVIVRYRNAYYLFSTNQWGYWHSSDLLEWTFVPRRFLLPEHKVEDDLCAPAVWVQNDALHLLGSSHVGDFPVWKSSNPTRDDWSVAVKPFPLPAWDPTLFLDDDGRLYLYYGSSNVEPIRGVELDPVSFQPRGQPQVVLQLDDARHGWERFGEHHDNTFLRPFAEGAWMNRHAGRYYLQYGAPGTEFSGYADGVYTSDKPLGPFEYQLHNPFALKPGGFARGAGHGATFADRHGAWWHVGTIAISVKNNFERRLGMWPAAFDGDGALHCDTAFGDFPHHLADAPRRPGQSTFTGWMLLNYAKPVRASSTLGGYAPNFAVDEDIRTYWSAATGDAGEWFESDLGAPSTIEAVQINYADQDVDFVGKQLGLHTRYRLLASRDGADWTVLADRSQSTADRPHDYIDLPEPIEARYVRLENVAMPGGKFALSGLRVFGRRPGQAPSPVQNFIVLRGASERRNAWLKWKTSDDASGYVIYAGPAADKLYTSVMIWGASEYYFRFLHRDQPHFFTIVAFNESGVSPRAEVVRVE